MITACLTLHSIGEVGISNSAKARGGIAPPQDFGLLIARSSRIVSTPASARFWAAIEPEAPVPPTTGNVPIGQPRF